MGRAIHVDQKLRDGFACATHQQILELHALYACVPDHAHLFTDT